MLIKNAKVFIDGKYRELEVQYDQGIIIDIGTNLKDDHVIDANGNLLFAGMIDTHIHGAFTYGFYDNGDNPEEQIKNICKLLPKNGVTSCIPTIDGGIPLNSIIESTKTLRKVRKNIKGADPFKIHYEGPYINPKQSASINPDYHEIPSKEHTLKMADGDLSDIALICVAPELPGAMEWISWVTKHGVKVEAGYTQATSDVITNAANYGLTQTSHLYNGYQPMHHRINGPIIGCLLDDRINAQLTCDGNHVSSDWIKLAIRLKGVDHIYGITDMISWSGLPEGEYHFPYYEDKTIIIKDGEIKDEDGMIIGGNMTWNEIMRTAKHKIGLTMEEIGSIYSESPAKCLDIKDRGKIEIGRRADFVIMDEEFNVIKTIILGEIFYETN